MSSLPSPELILTFVVFLLLMPVDIIERKLQRLGRYFCSGELPEDSNDNNHNTSGGILSTKVFSQFRKSPIPLWEKNKFIFHGFANCYWNSIKSSILVK